MNKQLLAVSAALVLGAGIAAEALAQANRIQLIAQRKGAMNLQVKYFGPILAMGLGRVPYDARIVQRNADYLAVLVQLPWDDFQSPTAGVANSMYEVIRNTTSQLIAQDLDPLIAYLRSLPPLPEEPK